MKIIEFKTEKGEFAVIELPEGAINPTVSMGYLLYKEYNESNGWPTSMENNPAAIEKWLEKHDKSKDYTEKAIKLPFENAELFGKIEQLTEERAKEIEVYHRDGIHYKKLDGLWLDRFATATESFYYRLEANGIHFENPFGATYSRGHDGESDLRSFLSWNEAQSKLWNKENTYLFKKI